MPQTEDESQYEFERCNENKVKVEEVAEPKVEEQ